MIQTAVRRCGICHRMHVDDTVRYRCANCGETLCAALVWNGKDFGRRNEMLHVHEITKRDTGRKSLRPCGPAHRVGVDVEPANILPPGDATPS